MIAVIKTGGKQYKVTENLKLNVEKLPAEAGTEFVFDQVLLISDDAGKDVKVGTPLVDGAKVTANILNHGKGKKIDVVKYKSKVRYMKKIGHRQEFSEVEIKTIQA